MRTRRQITFVPVRPGVYRKIVRKNRGTSQRRKPLGPPIQFPSQPRVGFDFRERAAGAEIEARMDVLSEMIDGVLREDER